MPFNWEPRQREFLDAHNWCVLATGKKDGSPQQSMVGYAIDSQGRFLVSVKSYTAKWHNVIRQPRVSATITDGRSHLVVYGHTQGIDADPQRAELTAEIFAALSGNPAPDPTSIISMLDEQQRTVLRITPTKTLFHE